LRTLLEQPWRVFVSAGAFILGRGLALTIRFDCVIRAALLVARVV